MYKLLRLAPCTMHYIVVADKSRDNSSSIIVIMRKLAYEPVSNHKAQDVVFETQ